MILEIFTDEFGNICKMVFLVYDWSSLLEEHEKKSIQTLLCSGQVCALR